LVFTTELGAPLDPRKPAARRRSRRQDRRALEGIGAHTLRHSVAVGWLESRVHIKAVADLLGHSGVSITGDAYGHASDDTARAAVDGLEWGARTVNGLSNSHENAPGSWHIGGWRA
jgi:integrase